MKKFYSLFVCLLMACSLCTLTSCLGDEEEELIEETQIEKYTKDIVGYWECSDTGYTWRFDAQGNGTVYGNGEKWDSEESAEGDKGNNLFRWHFSELGLNIEIMQYSVNGDPFFRESTESPFKVNSLTANSMVLTSADGEIQHFTRIKK